MPPDATYRGCLLPVLRHKGRQRFADQLALINTALVCDRFKGALVVRCNACLDPRHELWRVRHGLTIAPLP
jgi:hypothetical protein